VIEEIKKWGGIIAAVLIGTHLAAFYLGGEFKLREIAALPPIIEVKLIPHEVPVILNWPKITMPQATFKDWVNDAGQKLCQVASRYVSDSLSLINTYTSLEPIPAGWFSIDSILVRSSIHQVDTVKTVTYEPLVEYHISMPWIAALLMAGLAIGMAIAAMFT